MEKIMTLNGGKKYFAVDRGEKATGSLIPEKMAVADVAAGFQILFHLRDVEAEKRKEFSDWIFSKLRWYYSDTLPEVFDSYLESRAAQALIAEMEGKELAELTTQIDQIVEESGFGEEQDS